ncbi:hypothetical protein GV828_09475 [Flavobacterium sp. NST-5]|uniref:Uncharacterized protein n=1 Tax=Flavobacterium ichthyis TaxID=2698827 RepID=A0ABW9ZDP7_9FLAO|nr:hypothetical protein [Flavobacterium ichthyis]NBL65427.1 hypothetical protein [Flavobacterium ichthyis]
MKSKLSLRAYIMGFCSFPLLVSLIFLFFNRKSAFSNHYNLKFLFIGILGFLAFMYILIATYKRAILIEILDKHISVKNIFSKFAHYDFEEFDGFQTVIETSKGGSFEVLYLIIKNRRVVPISEFHQKNYHQLKIEIANKVKNLGEVPFNFLRW